MLLGPKMKGRGLPWRPLSVKAGQAELQLLFDHRLTIFRRNRTYQMIVCAREGGRDVQARQDAEGGRNEAPC
jgi:hypothetical protein